MTKQKLILIGNGMAGMRCIEEILIHSPDCFDITVFGSEPHVNYNRILLSTVLQGSTKLEDINIHSLAWYKENNITLFKGESVTHIDTKRKIIKTDKNRETRYDKLIIATGSSPYMLPVKGLEKEGVLGFRTIEDCQKMIEISKQYKKAAVIGGGLLGLEAARGLLNLGMDVQVIHHSGFLMERQLDKEASNMLREELEQQGISFLLNKRTDEVIGESRVGGIRFDDNSKIAADLVVMATGVRPNVNLAKKSGIETNRAIIVNDYLETSIPDIYAVGECAEHRGMTYGLVAPLYEQGKVLARTLCQIKSEGYQGSVLSTQLKISGIDVYSVGEFKENQGAKAITISNMLDGIYKKVVFREGKIVGAVLFGDTSDAVKLSKMISEKKDLSLAEKIQLFPSQHEKENAVASMSLPDIVCNCNGVTKGAIIEAVQKNDLTTVDEIKNCTKASGSCGGCKPLVTDLLTYIQSDEFDEVIEEKTFCACTHLSEDELVREMQRYQFETVQQVREVLKFEDIKGCSLCEGGLHYYLEMMNPHHENDPHSLFITENEQAVLLHDGTYSVVPQIHGGLTNVQELRNLANVAEKYNISTIRLTNDQRIQLIGVKKEYLPLVREEIDRGLQQLYERTVKNVSVYIGKGTCICQYEPALALSNELDKQLEYVKTPCDIKISIASCSHIAESVATSDIGLRRIDRGWEIYAGGSSAEARSGELFYVAETNEEAVEISCSLIQYYRETGNYLETVGTWIERVGIVHVREVLFDVDNREYLMKQLSTERSRAITYLL
ncbi:NAD(P)/FAD-dependent oxidoreductase [Bacillus megaterium]|uniref:nitrite reductase large subunit NirB n=1 Tax=Priestia megaterium TaxID=1404 RepID=UPI00129310A8|nr:nitrite reductase large subunit NirB [Priestia megaterium]MQR87786.1 NAD(P)/FAD-dependent oxidoreductase [Priestia megaterium]